MNRLSFIVFLGFLCLCLVGGGGSRADIQSLMFVRPAAVICIATLLLLPGRVDFRAIKTPLLLLAGLAVVMLLQLVPLPPEVWTQLPGHARFAEAAVAAGIPQPWRPISVAPDLTLNSFVSLVVPAAALIGLASITSEQNRILLPIVIGAALLSALLGMAQLSGGPASNFYFFRITNANSAVGFFANRNHQAVFLASALPMLALWATLPAKDRQASRGRMWVSTAIGLFLLPMIAVTGSRAGMILAGIGLIAASFLVRYQQRTGHAGGKWSKLVNAMPWLLGILLMVVAVISSRAIAIQRLFSFESYDDGRIANLPLFIRMAADFFPTGSGFGTFDPLFRIREPDARLSLNYLNHAHNDMLELGITGGLFGAILLILFLLWWARRSIVVLRKNGRVASDVAFARLASIIVLMLLLASLVDYPLRTPTMAALFAIACGWLERGSRAATQVPGGSDRAEAD